MTCQHMNSACVSENDFIIFWRVKLRIFFFKRLGCPLIFFLASSEFQAPPSAPPPPPDFEFKSNDATGWQATGMMTAEQAFDALAEHIATNCCWGDSPMKRMKIESGRFSTSIQLSDWILIPNNRNLWKPNQLNRQRHTNTW